MNILSIATTHPRYPGDSEPAFVFYLNRELARLGHEVTTIVPHAQGASLDEVVEGVHVKRFRYFLPAQWQRLCYNGGIVPNLRRSWLARVNLPFFLARLLVVLWGLLRKKRFDLIHCHWLVPQGLFAALLNWRAIPLVLSAHGGDVYTAGALFKTANRFALRHCSICVAVSKAIEDQVKLVQPDVRTDIISMGVDLSRFGPHQRDLKIRERIGGDPIILFVGRLAEKKGASYLVEAAPKILQHFPTARIALVGAGPERKALQKAIESNGVEGRVLMLGSVAQAEMPRYMASADLFVMPSVVAESGDREGLGVVLLEALASGTPVVCSDVGGVGDVVKHRQTGLLARQKDPSDLAEKCIEMLSNQVLQRETVECAGHLLAARFDWPRVAQQFDRVFRSCVFAGEQTMK